MFAEFEKQIRIVCLVEVCYAIEPTFLIRKAQQKTPELALDAKEKLRKLTKSIKLVSQQ